MAARRKTLSDDAARRDAIAVHDRSFLVEAGAGSGKTAVMAGRIAMLLAGGVAPKHIAAVTFTEFAASELLIRVRAFVGALAAGDIPTELRVALPDGLSDEQRGNLAAADAALDEMTCSTIHVFCQRLITPYPVEADIDPGAAVMDRDQADLAFAELIDAWLREELAGETGGLLAELVLHDPTATLGLIRTVLDHLRRHRAFAPYERHDLAQRATAFREAVEAFNDFLAGEAVEEPETAAIASHFRTLAEEVGSALPADTPAGLVRLLVTKPHDDLLSSSGGFYAYRKKGKWGAAAKKAGLSKADADRLNDTASTLYALCCARWTAFHGAVATHVLADLVPLVEPVMARFREHKRAAALLDFDDLIFAARDLLRDHDEVRQALAKRFSHVLVDEFQDTDPLQTEIFWRLCGEPPADEDGDDWTAFALRPGALFLVGDPKQAIYRFRGADIAAYVTAREAFRAQAAKGVLSIATNFRSCAPIMEHVNERFEVPLSEEKGQPGFQALDPFLPKRAKGPSVAALVIAVADENGKASAPRQRDGEAEAVADMCARLIGSEQIRDPKSGEQRPCRAGDIALLAPTGSELWRYEEALEQRGIPVATQAGKGLYRRQEIQDLIALTRVLADQRDRLALGALLRGPLVGMTEEELLDIVWALPRADDAPDALPRLDLGVAPETIAHPHARDIIEKLQALRRRVNATTPHALLSQAVDVLRVRPILLGRHRGQAERALANVDLYLTFSRAYAVRGLRAFAEAMTAAWSDEARAVEGRPDAQEEAVALYTMHAAKGLEWPIVVPINTMTQLRATETAVTDRASGRFFLPRVRGGTDRLRGSPRRRGGRARPRAGAPLVRRHHACARASRPAAPGRRPARESLDIARRSGAGLAARARPGASPARGGCRRACGGERTDAGGLRRRGDRDRGTHAPHRLARAEPGRGRGPARAARGSADDPRNRWRRRACGRHRRGRDPGRARARHHPSQADRGSAYRRDSGDAAGPRRPRRDPDPRTGPPRDGRSRPGPCAGRARRLRRPRALAARGRRPQAGARAGAPGLRLHRDRQPGRKPRTASSTPSPSMQTARRRW